MKKRMMLSLLFLLAVTTVSVSAQSETVKDYSFAASEALEVKGAFFAVEVRAGQNHEILLRSEIPESLLDKVEVRYEESFGKLRVWVEYSDTFFISVNALTGIPRLIFTVPAGIDLQVVNNSGSVYAEGIRSQELRAETASGKLELQDITANITAATNSGAMKLTGCDGVKDLRSSSGMITLRNANGAVAAVSSSGAQFYQETRGDLQARSSSGGIRVENMEGGLDLEASSGSLIGTGILLTKDSSFQTSSGSINFAFRNYLSDFRFELSSGSGSLKVGPASGRGDLVYGNGRIKITGHSSSGSQLYTGVR